jgi:hypothetical protein
MFLDNSVFGDKFMIYNRTFHIEIQYATAVRTMEMGMFIGVAIVAYLTFIYGQPYNETPFLK